MISLKAILHFASTLNAKWLPKHLQREIQILVTQQFQWLDFPAMLWGFIGGSAVNQLLLWQFLLVLLFYPQYCWPTLKVIEDILLRPINSQKGKTNIDLYCKIMTGWFHIYILSVWRSTLKHLSCHECLVSISATDRCVIVLPLSSSQIRWICLHLGLSPGDFSRAYCLIHEAISFSVELLGNCSYLQIVSHSFRLSHSPPCFTIYPNKEVCRVQMHILCIYSWSQ